MQSSDIKSLLDLQQLDVKDEGRIGRDSWHTSAAIGVLRWNSQASLSTDLHTSNTDVPALDDFASAELEGEWFARLIS